MIAFKKIITLLFCFLVTSGLLSGSDVSAQSIMNDWNWDYRTWDRNTLNNNWHWQRDWEQQLNEARNQIRFREFNQRIGYDHEDFYKFNDWMRQHQFSDFDDYNRYSGNKFKNWDDFNQYFGNHFDNFNDLSRMMKSHRFKTKDDFIVFVIVFVNFDNFNHYCNNNRFKNFDDFKSFTKNNNFGNFNDYNRYFGNRWNNYNSFNQSCGNRYNNFSEYWNSVKYRSYNDFETFSNHMMYDR